jgi:hypothetical protein
MACRAVALALAATISTATPHLVRAQTTGTTPELVAEQFLAAIRDTNWAGAARLMHPSALAQLHGFLRPLLECPGAALDQARGQLLGVTSLAEAARLPDTTVVAAFLRLGLSHQQGLASVLQTAQLHIIGHVGEGADTVHVLARLTFRVDSLPVSAVEVFSLQRHDSTWRALLKGDFSSLGGMLQRACAGGS